MEAIALSFRCQQSLLRRVSRRLLIAIVVTLVFPSSSIASNLLFDRSRMWFEAGVATGVADSGQTRLGLSLGAGMYLNEWVGMGVGIGVMDVYDNPGFASSTYNVFVVPIYAQLELTPWRGDALSVFVVSDLGFAHWVIGTGLDTEPGSKYRSISGTHLAFGLGIRHRLPGSRFGVFGQVKYMPEVGPDVAWPLLSFTVGVEG